MEPLYKVSLFAMLCIGVCSKALSQSDCNQLSNGDFANFCNVHSPTRTNNTCPTFNYPSPTNSCLPNWRRSHGTPEVIVYNSNPAASTNVVFMWAYTNIGEGIFGGFNFIQGHRYQVSLRVMTNNGNGVSGIRVWAANGITEPNSPAPGSNQCGDAVPWVANKQIIGDYSGFNAWTWKNITFSTIISSSGYNQIWVYPYTEYPYKTDFYVEYVYICDEVCDYSKIYSDGVVPAGESRYTGITAGTTAGSGGSLVTTSGMTIFTAANQVVLKPEFVAKGTDGGFWARIAPCSTQTSITTPDYIEDEEETTDTAVGRTAATNFVLPLLPSVINQDVYPNPITDKLIIRSLVIKDSKVEVTIFDVTGRVIQRQSLHVETTNSLTVDCNALSKGVYFLRIDYNGGKTRTSKFVKQ